MSRADVTQSDKYKLNLPNRGRSLPREVDEQRQGGDSVIAVMRAEAVVSEACRA